MARKLRVQHPGAIYHAMNRGDRREAIFRDDTDRRCFKKGRLGPNHSGKSGVNQPKSVQGGLSRKGSKT